MVTRAGPDDLATANRCRRIMYERIIYEFVRDDEEEEEEEYKKTP